MLELRIPLINLFLFLPFVFNSYEKCKTDCKKKKTKSKNLNYLQESFNLRDRDRNFNYFLGLARGQN